MTARKFALASGSSIAACSKAYEARWTACLKRTLSNGQRAIVRATKLYFFMADPREWVAHMVLGDPLPEQAPRPPRAQRAPRARAKKQAAAEGGDDSEEDDPDFVPS